ncbi:hypothetical protein [Nostoc sp.]|uniref:hypothetical protein n=1 Tax=Nostoc sp. TaxID=1180 RepID=UPI002FF546C7
MPTRIVFGWKVHDKLYQWTRVAAGREPSRSKAAVDSQSVETATMISLEVGYDAFQTSSKLDFIQNEHLSFLYPAKTLAF